MSRADAPAPDDLALLDRIAGRIVASRMEVAAVVALETARPFPFLASQALAFLEPFGRAVAGAADLERFRRLAADPGAIARLRGLIEQRVAARREGGA